MRDSQRCGCVVKGDRQQSKSLSDSLLAYKYQHYREVPSVDETKDVRAQYIFWRTNGIPAVTVCSSMSHSQLRPTSRLRLLSLGIPSCHRLSQGRALFVAFVLMGARSRVAPRLLPKDQLRPPCPRGDYITSPLSHPPSLLRRYAVQCCAEP